MGLITGSQLLSLISKGPSVAQRQEHDLPDEAKSSPQKTGGRRPGYWHQAPVTEDKGAKKC